MNASTTPAGPGRHQGEIGRCQVHNDVTAVFVCNGCKARLCEACAKRAGAYHIRICSICGFLCGPLVEYDERADAETSRRQSFGLVDLSIALRYPLQQGLRVFLLAAVYGAAHFSLAFFALDRVGLLLGGIGMFPTFVADSMMFAYMSSLIAIAERGKATAAHAPDESALLADFLDQMILGFAVYASLAWPWVAAFALRADKSRAAYITIAWAIVYYPASMLVRSISKSFWSILNPLAGMTIVVKLGPTYIKLFVIYLSIVAVAGVPLAYVFVETVEGAFSIPAYVVLGALFSMPVFYLNLVIAVLIGRAMFKSGERIEQLR